MSKIFTVCGIDASTSSTGVCFSRCYFDPKPRQELLDLLINLETECDPKILSDCFEIIHETEIKTPKFKSDKLTKIRKTKREALKDKESPSIKDNAHEEIMVADRFRAIVWQTVDLIKQYKPDIVVLEDYSYRSQGSTTQLAELKGALKLLLIEEGLWDYDKPYFFTAPIPSVKKIASTMGNATKELICENMTRYGFEGYEGMDDQLDAIAISLSTFYAIYYRIFGFTFPTPPKAKDKQKIKSWVKCLENFANRLGTAEELQEWVS